MNFFSPLMLLGVLGAMIPVVVHLQGRRKAKVVSFAALDFLIGTDKKLAKRLMLRQLLLLVFRVLICLAIPLILSKPYAACQSPGPQVSRGPQAVVMIVDNSFIAGYKVDGVTLLSKEISAAQGLLDQLGPEADVAIVTSTNPSRGELTRDHLSLRENLAEVDLSFQTPDSRSALQRAQQMLAGSGHARKTIFLLAIPSLGNIPPKESFAISNQGQINTVVVDPSEGTDLPNTAITGLELLPNSNIGSRGVTVVARVANYSSESIVTKIELLLGDKVVARGELDIPEGQVADKRFSADLMEQPRTAEIAVRLAGDGLQVDNVRHLVADARDQVRVLLVNGDPRTVRHEDELYYLEAALRPGDRGDSGTILSTCTADSLGDLELSAFDVIVLANVPALDTNQVVALTQWVNAGGGLLMSMGGAVDVAAYNRQMAPLLATSLRSFLDLGEGNEHAARLSKIEFEHPIFSVFRKDAPGLYKASFTKQTLVETMGADGGKSQVLARYDNGAAALVEARKGSGLLLLFTSSLDRDWNDLAIHPGYLPLAQQMVRYLAVKPAQRRNKQTLVGDSVTIVNTPGDIRLEVVGPNGIRRVIEGDPLARKHTRLNAVSTPGVYRVQSVNGEGLLQQRPEAAFAANIDASVSDLRSVATDHLRGTSVGNAKTEATVHTRRVELWHAIAAVLLFLLLLESVASAYGSRNDALG